MFESRRETGVRGEAQQKTKLLQLNLALIEIAHREVLADVIDQLIKADAVLSQAAAKAAFTGVKVGGNLLDCDATAR